MKQTQKIWKNLILLDTPWATAPLSKFTQSNHQSHKQTPNEETCHLGDSFYTNIARTCYGTYMIHGTGLRRVSLIFLDIICMYLPVYAISLAGLATIAGRRSLPNMTHGLAQIH